MQDSLAAALVTQIALRLDRLDPAQCLRGIDDGDAGMSAERQQMLTIPGDDQIGLRSEGGGDDLLVIDIAGHDPRHVSGRDQLDDLDVIGEYRGGCLIDEREALGGGRPGEYVGQFFEQRGTAVSAAAAAHGIDPALLASIGVRESGFMNVPEVGGGRGAGVFQLTVGPGVGQVTAAQAYNLAFAANYAAEMLASNASYLSANFPNLTSAQLLQATAASYNLGVGKISGNPDTIDVGSTKGNYGSNIVAPMSCFK